MRQSGPSIVVDGLGYSIVITSMADIFLGAVGPDTKPHFAHGSPCCRRLVNKSCTNHEELAVTLPWCFLYS
jgi:hypothetical protein